MPGDPRPERAAHLLEWRVGLFGAGAILAVIGMLVERRWLINVAIAILAVGALLRFGGEKPPAEPEDEE